MAEKSIISNIVNKVTEKIWTTMSFKLQLDEGTNEEAITEWGVVQTIRESAGIKKDSHFPTLQSDVSEKKSGADLEWWICERKGKKKRIIALSIQAKRLYEDDKYKKLDYKVNNGIYQTDVLIQHAKNRKMIPMYFFYNWFKDWETQKKEDRSKWGLTYAYADKIKQLKYDEPNSFKNREKLEPLMVPLTNLFCTDRSVIDTILEEIGEDPQKSNLIHTDYPSYIKNKFDKLDYMILGGFKYMPTKKRELFIKKATAMSYLKIKRAKFLLLTEIDN